MNVYFNGNSILSNIRLRVRVSCERIVNRSNEGARIRFFNLFAVFSVNTTPPANLLLKIVCK